MLAHAVVFKSQCSNWVKVRHSKAKASLGQVTILRPRTHWNTTQHSPASRDLRRAPDAASLRGLTAPLGRHNKFENLTFISVYGKSHRIRASDPPHTQILPRKIPLFQAMAKRCGRFPTGSDCSTDCLRSIPVCLRVNQSIRQ